MTSFLKLYFGQKSSPQTKSLKRNWVQQYAAGCGGKTRTYDLRVMRYEFLLFSVLLRFKNVIITRFADIVVMYSDGELHTIKSF